MGVAQLWLNGKDYQNVGVAIVTEINPQNITMFFIRIIDLQGFTPVCKQIDSKLNYVYSWTHNFGTDK